MDMTDDKQKEELPEEDKIVFVPDEIYRNLHSALHQMEMAREELVKITERKEE